MSKRRNRKGSPNIPQEILERARQQIAGEEAASAEDPETTDEEVVETPQPVAKAVERSQPPKARTRRREGLQPARLGEKRINPNDPYVVRQKLENPTLVVTEEEMRQEYGYVLADLRSMALLAVGLVIALIVVAQLL